MIKQRQISKNIGRDTHVRDHASNMFQSQNHETYGMQVGEIAFVEPEPLFKQNIVTVNFARGGRRSSVAYPGAFIDPISGNLHGTYEGPIAGQMVTVGFENGNQNSPFVVNRYPYQGKGNTLTESGYTTPLTKAGFESMDVIIGHVSGSFLSFNTGLLIPGRLPGSVNLNAVTNLDISSLLGGSISMSATGIEIESSLGISLESSVLGETLKSTLESLIDQINLITVQTPVGPSGPPNNAAAFTAIKATLSTILSLGVKNN